MASENQNRRKATYLQAKKATERRGVTMAARMGCEVEHPTEQELLLGGRALSNCEGPIAHALGSTLAVAHRRCGNKCRSLRVLLLPQINLPAHLCCPALPPLSLLLCQRGLPLVVTALQF